jgi:hypothetical protein
MDVNLWALVFSVIAATASIIVARWEWFDRPQHDWRFQITKDNSRPWTVEFEIHAEGTAVAVNVRTRLIGFLDLTPSETKRHQSKPMTTGTEPIKMRLEFPSDEGDPAFVEIVWTTPRPLREHGRRWNGTTGDWQEWKWHWRSLRLRQSRAARQGRARLLGRFRGYRLVRTEGEWVPYVPRPIHEIPPSQDME